MYSFDVCRAFHMCWCLIMGEYEPVKGFVFRRKQFFASLEHITDESCYISGNPNGRECERSQSTIPTYTAMEPVQKVHYSKPSGGHYTKTTEKQALAKWHSLPRLDTEPGFTIQPIGTSIHGRPKQGGLDYEAELKHHKPHWTVVFSQRLHQIRQKFETKCRPEQPAKFRLQQSGTFRKADVAPSNSSSYKRNSLEISSDYDSLSERSQDDSFSGSFPPPPQLSPPPLPPISLLQVPPSPPLPPPPSPLTLFETRYSLNRVPRTPSPKFAANLRPTRQERRYTKNISNSMSCANTVDPQPQMIYHATPGIQGKLDLILQRRSENAHQPFQYGLGFHDKPLNEDFSKWFSEGYGVYTCVDTVLKIRTVCHARDLWKLAQSYKETYLLCLPDSWNLPRIVLLSGFQNSRGALKLTE